MTITESPAPPNLPPSPVSALPSSTPYPATAFLNDQWQQIEVPGLLAAGLSGDWLAFTNFNERRPTANTPEVGGQTQTLFLVKADSRQRIEVAEIPASVGDRVFWSPTGGHVAYFVEEAIAANGQAIGGLYMLDFRVGLQYRLFGMRNLNPRSIPGHVPVWSADGSRLALVLPTDYATDIFILRSDGGGFSNLTQHPSYELYPAFSPDGVWLAFVSDRLRCPTWAPLEANSCDAPNASPPRSGNLFILNLATGETRQVTDLELNGPPQWITNTQLAFSTGGGNPLAETSELWLVNIEAGSAVQISPTGSLGFSESWAGDAGRVVYQRAGTSTEIVLADAFGNDLAVSSEYIFPRFGLAADWSPQNDYLAIAGRNGQCPYGILVLNANFELLTAPARNLLACDPVYAPGGRYLAFTAIQPSSSTDGRLDIYIANLNGLGASNITASLRGQMRLLGWVGDN
jgi:Tol biopolymer transport system component